MPTSPPTHSQQKRKVRGRILEKQRPSSHERGYDALWRKQRLAELAEEPLCAECARNGRTAAASVRDHIIPHKGDMKLFWDETNWQALCKTCHDRKTATEDGRWG